MSSGGPHTVFFKTESNINSFIPNARKNIQRKFGIAREKLGQNQLGHMMKKISSKAQLSKVFTNHCIRETVVSELHQRGFSFPEISTVTGHKTTESVSRYIRQNKDATKRKLSSALHDALPPIVMHSPESAGVISVEGNCSGLKFKCHKSVYGNQPVSNQPTSIVLSGNFQNCTSMIQDNEKMFETPVKMC